MEVPWAVSPQTHLDWRGPLLCSAWPLCQGTWSLHRPSALGHVPLGTWRRGALPFTPFSSQKPSILSFLFPSFILFAFFLPHLAPPHLLVPVKGKSLCSRGFLESSASCGHLAGGRRRVIQQVLGGLKGTSFHPGQHLPLGWFVFGSAASHAGHEGQVMRPPLIPWLSLLDFKVGCPRGTSPCSGVSKAILFLLPGLSADAQR